MEFINYIVVLGQEYMLDRLGDLMKNESANTVVLLSTNQNGFELCETSIWIFWSFTCTKKFRIDYVRVHFVCEKKLKCP